MTPRTIQELALLKRGENPTYKKTDFGIFPCNWETAKTFGDLFDFAMGWKGLVIDYEQQ